jgi:hypothetical protein
MKILKPVEPFGQVHIPPLSSDKLTATYTAIDWHIVRQSWKIKMYWTFPGTNEPVEMPSVTFGIRI